MNDYYNMKLAFMAGSDASRTLRKWERKCVVRARKNTEAGRNYPEWNEKRENFYTGRMKLRQGLRILHLARAYLKGLDYKQVESSVREGNEPDPMWIAREIAEYPYEEVEAWLNA